MLQQQRSAGPRTYHSDNTQGNQHIGPTEGRGGRIGFHRQRGLDGCTFEDGNIAHAVQGNAADCAGVFCRDRVAGDIAAGGAAGVGGNSGIAVAQGVTVRSGGVVRLPLDLLQRQGASVFLNGLGDVLGILTGEVGIAALGGDLLGGAAIARRLHLDGIKSERQVPNKSIVGDELLFLGQQGQDRFHILFLAREGDGLRMLAALIFR